MKSYMVPVKINILESDHFNFGLRRKECSESQTKYQNIINPF